ncbi:MAG: proprotein convertase P-domain-containing protein, partial [Planctomycetota bacterium]
MIRTIASLCAAGLAVPAAGQLIFSGVGGVIPDDGGPGNPLSSTITVTDDFSIADVSVNLLDLNHTFVGDLIITLSNGSTSVELINQAGVPDFSGFGWAYNLDGDYTYSDDGTITWDTVNGGVQDTDFLVPSGTYAPEGALSAFDGLSSAGSWTLSISDNAGLDTGDLGGWELSLTPVPAPGS